MPRFEDEIRRVADRAAPFVKTAALFERLSRRKRRFLLRRRAGAGVLAVAVIAGIALGTSALNQVFRPASGGGQVAFIRFLRGCPEHPNVSGALEVFAVDLATSEERLVSHVATWPDGSYRSEDWADFSPDGEMFAWVDHYRDELYVTDVRTGETRKLTSGLEVGQPHFSPDGTRILFQSGAEEGPIDLERDDQILEDAGEIYSVGLDGSAPDRITNGHLPTWTSDGRIAFARSRWTVHLEHEGGAIRVTTTPLPTPFFLMDPDGSDLEEVYEAAGDAQIGDAEWSPDGDRIAAEVTTHGNTDIYVLDLDTRVPLRLTDTPAEDTSPTWSPDGSFIAFHTGRWGSFTGHAEIAMIPAGGGAVTRLTHDACFRDSDPTWVPDPAAVASLPVWTPPPPPELGEPGNAEDGDVLFNGEQESVWDLFAIDPATGEVTNLTADLADQLSPEWSPDHTQIAFAGNVEERGNLDIYVMDADGSALRRLTSGPGVESRPSWSPDGSQIAFEADDGVSVMNADGSGRLHVAGRPAAGGYYPAWSPDGSLIAFSEGEATAEGPSFVIKLVAPDGTGLRELTSAGDVSYFPSWSPDGSRIAFICDGDICVMNADGTGLVNLTSGETESADREPDWSPDGSEIVFASARDGSNEMQLFAMAPDGSNVHRLSNIKTGCCAEPDW